MISDIICMYTNDNWNDVFKEIFVDNDILDSKLRELDQIRNSIAHNRDLAEDDTIRLKLLANDILKCLEVFSEK
jgi:hypothetical protein